MLHTQDNIVALASAPGGAARGIVRLSGSAAVECLGKVFVPEGEEASGLWRRLSARSAASVIEGRLQLDDALWLPVQAYMWPGERSYTRSPLVELHTLGSPPLLDWAMEALCAAGARPAQPGEFTLRAFLAGRLDLTQAEAVLGVIDAGSSGSLRTALAQLAGGLAEPLTALRDQLLDLLARLEAGLDFVEEDIEFISQAELLHQLNSARQQLAAIAAQLTHRTAGRELPKVVLAGRPNAGKSSLFNSLLKAADEHAGEHPARPALVSEVAGTTRDYLAAEFDLGSVRCLLIDTAGITDDGLELDGQTQPERLADEAARLQHSGADLVLLCVEASQTTLSLDSWPKFAIGKPSLLVFTKADTTGDFEGFPPGEGLDPASHVPQVITSSRTGAGLHALRELVAEQLHQQAELETGAVAATAVRCQDSLRLARESLDRGLELVSLGHGEELVAAELRATLDGLGQVTGAVYTDDILDRIFSRFCIGK